MTTAAPDRRTTSWLIVRIGILLLLFILQIEIVEISLRKYFHQGNLHDSVWSPIVGSQRYIFSFIFVFLAAFLVIARVRLVEHAREFLLSARQYRWSWQLFFQLISYIGFAFLTWLLSTRYPESAFLGITTLLLWGVLLFSTAGLMLTTLAPVVYWRQFFSAEKSSLLVASLAGLMTMLATYFLMQSWPSMVEMTLHFSEYLLRLVYSGVFVIPDTSTLGIVQPGIPQFDVQVTRDCAGYEGMTLITVFLALYLWLFKEDLRFPMVFLLFPVGIVAMWLFNSLRIAVLVGIGSSYSPEIAIAGFHSNAGWIAFILVSLGLIAVMHRVPVFTKRQRQAQQAPPVSAKTASALLLPMMVLLAATLLTSAASSGFDWFYPLKVIATATVLGVFWKSYAFCRPYLNVEAIGIGIAIFFLWMWMVPADAEKTLLYSEELGSVAPWLALVWLVFRCIGSAITVPLAEELAFRGYILSRLSNAELKMNMAPAFSWLAFLASSLLFGIFHGAWIAGTIAGMGYALARYRRGRVSDAILAHMTTNALLSAYVLMTQQWSYW